MNKQKRTLQCLGTLTALCIATLACRAQDTAQVSAAGDRLTKAIEANSLGLVDSKPWHLKLNVTAFDDTGANPQPGSIEVWKSGHNMRTVYQFGGATDTRMVVDGGVYHSVPWTEIPYRAEDILKQVLHPGPEAREVADSIPELRTQSFGKVTLDCVMLSHPAKPRDEPPVGLYPTYCLDPGKDTLLVTFNFGAETVTVRSTGTFAEHHVPMKLDIQQGRAVVATGAIASLSSYVPQPDEFVPGPDLKSGTGTARIAGGVIAGQILKKVPPVYPEDAKRNHSSGTVVLHAIIGRDGHVHSLRTVNAVDPELAVAAIVAVRQWVYKPYLLNGEPTEVDSTITVNFNLSP